MGRRGRSRCTEPCTVRQLQHRHVIGLTCVCCLGCKLETLLCSARYPAPMQDARHSTECLQMQVCCMYHICLAHITPPSTLRKYWNMPVEDFCAGWLGLVLRCGTICITPSRGFFMPCRKQQRSDVGTLCSATHAGSHWAYTAYREPKSLNLQAAAEHYTGRRVPKQAAGMRMRWWRPLLYLSAAPLHQIAPPNSTHWVWLSKG